MPSSTPEIPELKRHDETPFEGSAQVRPAAGPSPAALSLTLLVLAAAAVSLNLRPIATSVGPVLEEIQSGLGVSAAVAGILTALPGLVFGLAGLTAVGIARRFGLVGTTCGGLVLVGLAGLVRSVTDSAVVFLLLSALALTGMGLGNVLVPAVIKRYSGQRTAAVTSVYTVGLGLGAALPMFATAPLLSLGGQGAGWHYALGTWAVVALIAAVIWAVMLLRVRGRDQGVGERATGLPIHRSRTAVALCAFFGLQSMNAYVQFGWLAQIYRDAGISAGTTALLVGTMSLFGIPGGLLMPQIAARSQRITAWTTALGLCMLSGWLGLLLAPAAGMIAWVLLLGIGQFTFPLALSLIVTRSGTPETTARLSGFAQPVGYLFAAAGPFVVGLLREATGGWAAPLAMLMASAVLLMGAGVMLGGGRTVDQDLAESSS